jgi:hypothetical protein
MLPYNPKDFSISSYRDLLKNLNTTHRPILYKNVKERNEEKPFVLLRHDVDMSPQNSLVLSKIEHQENIKSTYFIQLAGWFYNVFEPEIKSIFLEIKSLGHDIGLHFDPTSYHINSIEDLEKNILFEKNILEQLLNIKINVFSFHNPADKHIDMNEFEIAGLINAYSSFFKKNAIYTSDSNGYWRHQSISDAIRSNPKCNLQILTHPEWWGVELLDPKSKVKKIIKNRARETYRNHLYLMIKANRKYVK